MSVGRNRSGRLRFLAPVAVAGAIGLTAWIPSVTASASTPNLPVQTPQQVVAKALSTDVSGFSGSVRWTANLGIPDLGSLVGGAGGGDSFSPTTLLSGSHTVKVWYAGADRQRLALLGPLSEVDFVHNGQKAWYYDSSTDTVIDLVPAAGPNQHSSAARRASEPALTPDQIAARLLSHLTPSTRVRVASPVFVAGRPTYQLVLAPAARTTGAAASTVRQITIAVDAATGMPLRVQVFARAQSAPAVQIGFKSVSFRVPSAGEFAALSGTKVQTRTFGGTEAGSSRPMDLNVLGPLGPSGPAWGAVATFNHLDVGRAGRQITEATTQVTGSFGTAQLLQTSLINALIFPDGRVMAGFVTPSALEATAATGSP